MATTLATWTIDPVHSSVEFSLDYMGFSTYRTGFRMVEGSLEFDPARPAASSVNASIPVAGTIRPSRSRAPGSRHSTRSP
jgi:polyisoprenoid-binding protein YceI